MSTLIWEADSFVERKFDNSNLNGFYVCPGLVDSHVHGAFGYDFMEGSGNDVIHSLRKIGIEYVCLTTVTSDWHKLQNAISKVDFTMDGFCGFHLEGPYLNPKWAGAQPNDFKTPNFLELYTELGDAFQHIRVVTFAPELEGAIEFRKMLSKHGIIASAGHTDANYEELCKIQPDRMTHFFNAMKSFHHRAPGPIDFGLTKPVDIELIFDKMHVSTEAVTLVLNCIHPSRIIGISDGTALSGMPDGTTRQMWGHEVKKSNGKVELTTGTLAGSAVTLMDVFRNFWNHFSPEIAVLACAENPRKRLNLKNPKTWLVLNHNGEVQAILSDSDLH